MDNTRRNGLIATIAAAVLCGCPGLFALMWGAIASVVSFVPNAQIDIGGSSDPSTALYSGLGSMCLGVIFVGIAVAVGFFMLRRKPGTPAS